MFCFWHCFLYFVLFLISTVLELFCSEEVSCFRLWDIFISAVVLVLDFWSEFYSNLFLDMFCFWHCFSLFVLFSISTVCGLFHSKETSCFRLWDIFISAEVLVLAFWSYLSNLLLNMFYFWHCFLSFVLFLISTVCELFSEEEVSCFTFWDIFISHFEIFSFHILRYFHFCLSIGISFLVWSFYFIVKYVLFLTLLSFICFVSDFNCFRIIHFWRSILFQIVRYFHFCCSIGIRFLVWILF